MKIIIIADDLTGAADTGVQFLGMTGHSMKMSSLDHKISDSPCGGLSIHTQTRNDSELTAKLAMDRAADIARRMKPEIIYKKVDSCLRGHMGLELGALVRNMQFKGALVAPAYPTFGRVTRQGLHYVGDKLVSESEVARDPIRPVTDPSLANIIGQHNDCAVKNLPLELVQRGVQAVAEAISEMLSHGGAPVLIAADAATDHDLDVLAEAGLKFKDSLIFTGSAGLAGGLSRVTAGERPPLPEPFKPSAPIIYFGGSMSQNLKNQIKALVEAGHAESLTLDIHELIECDGDMPMPAPPAEGKSLALVLSQSDGSQAGEEFSHRLITAFGTFAANLVRAMRPGTIFMSGGDTAQAALSSLTINEVWLRREIMPGMVYMEADRMGIITKAGSFGPPDLLVELHKSVK